jgi:hypothetical protein
MFGHGDMSPTGPGPIPKAGSAVTYDAVGASDADGYGSSVPCLPYTDCPNGMGYPQIAARELSGQGFMVSLTNLGVPTSVIGPDFEALGQQYNREILGNFLVQEMPFVRTSATVVTIFAGGNEINTITSALGGGAGGGNPNAFIDAQVAAGRRRRGSSPSMSRILRACRTWPARPSTSARRRSEPRCG